MDPLNIALCISQLLGMHPERVVTLLKYGKINKSSFSDHAYSWRWRL
jgi:hypothetical protein